MKSVWNSTNELQAVCITCAFILSSESSSFTSFLQAPVHPAALHSWLLWGKLVVSVPRKGSWALQREKKLIWTCCRIILGLSWGYYLPLLFLLWNNILSAFLFLSSKRKHHLECWVVWGFFLIRMLQMLWSYYRVTLIETKRSVCLGLHDLASHHSWFCSLLYPASSTKASMGLAPLLAVSDSQPEFTAGLSRCSSWSEYKVRLKLGFRNYLESLQPNIIKRGVKNSE